MKKYLILMAVALFCCCSSIQAADFGDLLERLNSRDFSAEKDVLTGKGGVYVGELVNPHEDTVMFKARAEFREAIEDVIAGKVAASDPVTFILDAMKADVSDETKVWLLEQLSLIGGDQEVPVVAGLLKSDSRRIVDAAAACLAKIPGDAALNALEANKEIPAAAAALVSKKTTPIPAQGVESSIPLALSNTSQAEVDEWLKGYDQLSDWDKVQTLAGLTARDDKRYREYALNALKSESADLRHEGFLALEKMATADDVDIFIEQLAENHDLAIRLCGFVVADGFDEALLDRLDNATDAGLFRDLATILTNRAVDVRSYIFKRTTAADCTDRLELMQKVCELATTEDVPNLIETVIRFPRGKEHDAAENLVAGLCNRDASPIIALKTVYPISVLYPIMARTGGDAAREELSQALDSNDKATLEVALRALTVWRDATLAEKMLSLLEADNISESQKVAVLRAYIRVISLPDDQIGIELSRDQKLENLKNAFKLAKRDDEKILILSRLAANRTDKSLEFAIECAAIPSLAEAAYAAIADHAHDTAIRKQYPELVAKGIDLIINNSKDEKLIERVKIYKGRME